MANSRAKTAGRNLRASHLSDKVAVSAYHDRLIELGRKDLINGVSGHGKITLEGVSVSQLKADDCLFT